MDELGLFFKLLPDKGLIEKTKSRKGFKKSKIRLTADGEKLDEPVVIWRSKKLRCFSKITNPNRPNPLKAE